MSNRDRQRTARRSRWSIPAVPSGAERSRRAAGERAALNSPIQGTAADLIKLAMIKIDQRMKKEGVKSKMLLQVHDELIFDVVNGEEDLMKNIIEEEMTHAMELKVPLVAECKAGNSWYQVK